MDFDTIVRVLKAHGFHRVVDTYVWWYAAETDPVMATTSFLDYSETGKAEVSLVKVFGAGTPVPVFSVWTLATEWALDRCLTDMGCK